jgi:hypothetical protein
VSHASAGGGYVNFMGDGEGADRVRAAYGGNYERLAQVKAAYDPGNFFHLNHNIAPAGEGTGKGKLVGAPPRLPAIGAEHTVEVSLPQDLGLAHVGPQAILERPGGKAAGCPRSSRRGSRDRGWLVG